MIREKLTARIVKSARSTGLVNEIWDTEVPRFGLKVMKSGAKKWMVMYRRNGEFVRGTFGEYPDMSLNEARELAPKIQEETSNDVEYWAVTRVNERAAHRQIVLKSRGQWTFEEAVQDYMRFKTPNLRRGREIDCFIERELIPLWGQRLLSEITAYDVLDLTDTFLEAGLPIAANKRLEHVRRIFDWLIRRSIYGIDRSPTDRMSAPARRSLRTRVLLESEIKSLWEAAEGFGYPFGTHVQLLAMLGLRVSELTHATWQEFKLTDGSWTIPAERTKSGATRHIRLPRQAITLFKCIPHFGRRSGHFLFTTLEGRRPIAAIAKFKIRLDKQCGVRDWTYHDLRRTMRTNLSRLKVPGIVADLALGHSRPEMHRVYDQYGYENERAEALQMWANELERIVNPFPLFATGQN
jgi:integrase